MQPLILREATCEQQLELGGREEALRLQLSQSIVGVDDREPLHRAAPIQHLEEAHPSSALTEEHIATVSELAVGATGSVGSEEEAKVRQP